VMLVSDCMPVLVQFLISSIPICVTGTKSTFVPNCHYLEQKFSFLFKIHFLVRTHQTTTTKSLRIRPTMATLILAQYNNQPTISRH
jgi:hypothetical protein